MQDNQGWREPFSRQPRGVRTTSYRAGLRDESTGQLFRDFFEQGQLMVRQEVRLAKEELRAEAKSAGQGAGMIGAGGAILYAGVLVLLACAVALLALAMPIWVAALIVGALAVGVGALLLMGGRSRLQNLKPDESIETLKENREWTKGLMRDMKSRRHAHA